MFYDEEHEAHEVFLLCVVTIALTVLLVLTIHNEFALTALELREHNQIHTNVVALIPQVPDVSNQALWYGSAGGSTGSPFCAAVTYEMDWSVMYPNVVTIGVFGYRQESFFQALLDAGVDLLIDIRRRRALRGKAYHFANSTRLQAELATLGIRYLHRLDLAPSYATRQVQAIHDRLTAVTHFDRPALAPDFVVAYQRECLAHFDVPRFLDEIGPETRTFALFCVERTPAACHRSLVAAQLAGFGLDVVHLMAE